MRARSSAVCSTRSGLRWSVKQAANCRTIPVSSLGLAEQQSTAVGGDVATVEVGEDLTGADHGKVEVGCVTLCRHRAAFSVGVVGGCSRLHL